MSVITLKTANRKTDVSRTAVRKAVAATFVTGTLTIKNTTAKKSIKKVAGKSAA